MTTRDVVINAPFAGWLTPLDEVPDPVFAERMMGEGVAIDPTEAVLREIPVAPPDARTAATIINLVTQLTKAKTKTETEKLEKKLTQITGALLTA